MALVADQDQSRDRNPAQDRDPVDGDQDPTHVIEIPDPKVDQRVDQEVDHEADKEQCSSNVTSLNFSPITVLMMVLDCHLNLF